MKKKLVIGIIVTFMIGVLSGCGGNNKLITQGKTAMEKGDFEEAAALFNTASEENPEDEEAQNLYNLAYDYVIAHKAYEEFKLDVAIESIDKLEDNKEVSLIEDNVNELKDKVSKDKEIINNLNASIEKVNKLEKEGNYKEAKDILSEVVAEAEPLKDELKETLDSANNKIEELNKNLGIQTENQEIEDEKNKKISAENAKREKALDLVKGLGVIKKDQFIKLKSDEVYDLGDGSTGFIIDKYYQPSGKPEPAFICQYTVDQNTWKVKEIKDDITKELN